MCFTSASECCLGPDGLSRCARKWWVRSSRLNVSHSFRLLHFTVPSLNLFPCKCRLLLCLFSSIFSLSKSYIETWTVLDFFTTVILVAKDEAWSWGGTYCIFADSFLLERCFFLFFLLYFTLQYCIGLKLTSLLGAQIILIYSSVTLHSSKMLFYKLWK